MGVSDLPLTVNASGSVDVSGSPATSGQWGTGGMATKLQAAAIATAAGVRTVITRSTEPKTVLRIIRGEAQIGTQVRISLY